MSDVADNKQQQVIDSLRGMAEEAMLQKRLGDAADLDVAARMIRESAPTPNTDRPDDPLRTLIVSHKEAEWIRARPSEALMRLEKDVNSHRMSEALESDLVLVLPYIAVLEVRSDLLTEAVKALRAAEPFLIHRMTCEARDKVGAACTCGLRAFLPPFRDLLKQAEEQGIE